MSAPASTSTASPGRRLAAGARRLADTRVRPLTAAEVEQLPAVVSLWPTAANALGISRTTAYELARRGEFPVPVLRLGAQYRVATAHLRDALGLGA